MSIKHKDGTIEYTGLVLDTHTRSEDCGYDTVYYATVWDWNTMQVKSVYAGDTRTGNVATIECDATPIVLECYSVYKHNLDVSRLHRQLELQYLCPHKDFRVKVKSGRLVPIGTEGIVTHVYDTAYGVKLLFKDNNGVTHKTYAKNVEVTYIPLTYKPVLEYKPYPKYMQVLYQVA